MIIKLNGFVKEHFTNNTADSTISSAVSVIVIGLISRLPNQQLIPYEMSA